ncbi:hypothetical protein CRYUN_Cryun01aG0218000 [Craigia yunnanensis]
MKSRCSLSQNGQAAASKSQFETETEATLPYACLPEASLFSAHFPNRNDLLPASEDLKSNTSQSAVSTIVNLAEEAKLAREGVKAPSYAILSICKSLITGGVAGRVGILYLYQQRTGNGLHSGDRKPMLYTDVIIRCLTHSSFTPWSLSMCWDNCHVCNLPNGLNFSVYESLKDWLIKSKPFGLVEDAELSVTTRLACGAAAGTVGQTVAYPLDVIRRRMQMVGWKDAASVVTGDGRNKASLEYTGMIDAFRKTVRHEGFGALYKGLVPNSVKVVPSIALAFVTYEVVKDILGVEIKISD